MLFRLENMKLSSGVQYPPQHRDQELRPYIEPDLNLFVCNNGILDLDRGIFRNREPNDPLATIAAASFPPPLPAAPAVPISLLTGTPSRTSFPRGFLWDEGFHQLLMGQWDSALTAKVVSDWMHAMHFTADPACSGGGGGWIPREMILGDEATRRVPEEFITQRVDIANPPTLLLAVDSLVKRLKLDQPGAVSPVCVASDGSGLCEPHDMETERVQVLSFLARVYPLLHQWVQWYLDSQRGSEQFPGSFRWRGRSLSDQKVLPNTLSSGLDDYPRSALPSPEEHHVDLHCWMVTATRTMATLGNVLVRHAATYNLSVDESVFSKNAWYQKKSKHLLQRLHDLHWSPSLRGYFDVGLNSENATFAVDVFFKCANPVDNSAVEVAVPVEIARSGGDFCPSSHPKVLFPMGDGNGGYKMRERYVMDAVAAPAGPPGSGWAGAAVGGAGHGGVPPGHVDGPRTAVHRRC